MRVILAQSPRIVDHKPELLRQILRRILIFIYIYIYIFEGEATKWARFLRVGIINRVGA